MFGVTALVIAIDHKSNSREGERERGRRGRGKVNYTQKYKQLIGKVQLFWRNACPGNKNLSGAKSHQFIYCDAQTHIHTRTLYLFTRLLYVKRALH